MTDSDTMTGRHALTRADIMAMDDFAKIRAERRRAITEMKRDRRVAVGPCATFYFENRETMWWQIHEMLYIEKGGEAQIADELAAYNPLIPQGRELVATVMFEIPDEAQRRRFLATIGGVEETMELTVGDETVPGEAERDVDRTTASGKASAVHFVHFPLTEAQVARFRDPAVRVTVGIAHPAYGHVAVLSEAVRRALANDFD